MFGGKGKGFVAFLLNTTFLVRKDFAKMWEDVVVGKKGAQLDEVHQGRVPRCYKAEGGTEIEDRSLLCVTEPSCSARASSLHLHL